jgi:glycerol kinase
MFTTGACIQWLRDGLKLIKSAPETEILAREVADTDGVYFVPALSGLGAPHWDMSARGGFLGITGGVQREHMVRAVLESIAYQVKEVVDAMNKDGDTPISLLKVDGGASQNRDRSFIPSKNQHQAQDNFKMWQKAVGRAKNWTE